MKISNGIFCLNANFTTANSISYEIRAVAHPRYLDGAYTRVPIPSRFEPLLQFLCTPLKYQMCHWIWDKNVSVHPQGFFMFVFVFFVFFAIVHLFVQIYIVQCTCVNHRINAKHWNIHLYNAQFTNKLTAFLSQRRKRDWEKETERRKTDRSNAFAKRKIICHYIFLANGQWPNNPKVNVFFCFFIWV